MRARVGFFTLLTVLVGTAASAQGPVPVSPGGRSGVAVVSGRCPTFHWTAVEAEAIDLVVYRVSEDEARDLSQPLLSITLPGAANGWTPELEDCLESGGRYAWSVGTSGEWSEASLFEVSAAPSVAEVEQALETLQRFLDEKRAGERSTSRRPGSLPRRSALTFDTTGVRAQSTGAERAAALIDAALYVSGDYLGAYSRTFLAGGKGFSGRSPEGDGVYGKGGYAGVHGRGELYGMGGYFRGGPNGGLGLMAIGFQCCDGAQRYDHAVLLSNNSTGANPDVLALEAYHQSSPPPEVNFVTFFDSNGVIGELEGDGLGGVRFRGSVVSPSSDFAEYLPRLAPDDRFEPGEVVGLFGGHVSRRTRGADRAMVISTHPVVAGGRPHPDEAARHARVAFLGQVPVRVQGPVSAGDMLVPSGQENGTAVAVSAEELEVEQAPLVIGRSLDDSAGTEHATVRALVGLPDVAAAGLGAARRELRLYRSLVVFILITGLGLTVARWRFG